MRAAPSKRNKLALCAAFALLLPACEGDGNFKILGYTTRPNYDTRIKTIRVPIFQNKTFIRGVEFDLTKAVIREIEQKTPYKVVGPNCNADTELTGTITTFTKGLLNVNQINEVREAETTLACEVVWRDLRTGEYLTKPIRRPGQPRVPELQLPHGMVLGGPTAPTNPQEPAAEPLPAIGPPPPVVEGPVNLPNVSPAVVPEHSKPPAVVIRSMASFIPEVGQSRTTALQNNVNSIAVQIISMMETPW